VSPDIGWLLAASPCSAGTCATLLHTVDSGRTWNTLPALPADVPPDASGISFADTQTGYLFAARVLYLTRDGGATWIKAPGGANALDIAPATTLRISSATPGCPPGCTYQISVWATGTTAWHVVLANAGAGVRADLARSGHRAIVVVFGHLAGGGSAHGTLLTSADDGATWITWPDPCGTYQGGESASSNLSMASDGSATLLCDVRTGPAAAQTMVITSTDGGATFGLPHVTPGSTLALGSSSATTLFVSALADRTHRLYRSEDAGATWTVVATAPDRVPDGAVAPTTIHFLPAAQTGWWLPGYTTVFTTTDGGRHWSELTVTAR
jgi:photosystem II stability/assembly factor-like uncharacterized protein